MIMERKGTLVRFVDHLDISDNAKCIAEELIDQIEMPVVFLIDHDFDKQYAARSHVHHNQFWVLANHLNEQSEYERVILSNIYRGVQTRKRFLHPEPKQEYVACINKIINPKERVERLRLYNELLNRIYSFVSTIDAELYFKAKGFEVSDTQKQWLYDDRILRLDEYLGMQKKMRGFQWYSEVECINMLDYARIACFNEIYKNNIINRLKRVCPNSASKRCVNRLNELCCLIDNAYRKHSSSDKDIADWFSKEVVRILGLEKKLNLKRNFAFKGTFLVETGKAEEVYSYIPVKFDNERVIIKAMRYVNECIVLLQEYSELVLEKPITEVHANIIKSDHINAYANKLSSEYYLSFTSELLNEVIYNSQNCINNVSADVVSHLGESIVRSKIAKYALFYITAHEYAHVLHGDCEQVSNYQSKWNLVCNKEKNADDFARKILTEALIFQYRPNANRDFLTNFEEFNSYLVDDPVILNCACDWCDEFFSRLKT